MRLIDRPLVFICLLYFLALIVTIPISGGYLNPAITISAWIGNSEAQTITGTSQTYVYQPKSKATKRYISYIFAQIFGGLAGLGFGRLMRQHWKPTGTDTMIYRPPYAVWDAPI